MAATIDKRPTGDEYLCERLSTEILLNIGQHLTFADRIKLRAVLPKKRKQFVEDMLGPLNTLYVSPTKKSLRNFAGICASDFYQRRITDVAFVAQGIGSGPRWTVEENKEDFAGFQDIFSHYKLESQQQAWETEKSGKEPSEEVIRILAAGLSSLPKLKAVSVNTKIPRFGLNANSLWYGLGYEKELRARGEYRIRKTRSGRSAIDALDDAMSTNLEGIEEFLEALSEASPKLDVINLGADDEMGLHHELQRGPVLALRDSTVAKALSLAPNLIICCTDGPYNGDGQGSIWKSVVQSVDALQELTVFLYAYEGWSQGKQVLQYFLELGNYPQLTGLHIKATENESAVVDVALLVPFLKRHRKLRCVVLRQILICVMSSPQLCVDENIRSVLSFAADRLGERDGDFFELSAPRPEDDDLVRDLAVNTRDLERLADELGVELKNGTWDFGMAVTRSR